MTNAICIALVAEVGELEPALAELIAEWSPEAPPATVALDQLARALVELASPARASAVDGLFARIEGYLRDGTPLDRDAVATGFLEGLADALDAAPSQRWILEHVGPEARRFLQEWDAFNGIEPG